MMSVKRMMMRLGDDGPAEGQHLLEAAVHGLEVAVLGGAEVEAHLHLLVFGGVGDADDGIHVGEVSGGGVFAVGLHLDVGVLEGFALGGDDGAEVLLLEGNPVEVGLHLLRLVAAHGEVVHIVGRGFVVDAAVVALAVAVAVAFAAVAGGDFLLAVHAVVPFEVEVVAGADDIGEAHEVDVEVHLVAVAAHGVAELQVALVEAVGKLGAEADHRGVVALHGGSGIQVGPRRAVEVGGEDEVFGVHHAVVGGGENEVEVVVRGGDEPQVVAVVGHVIVEHQAIDAGTEVGEIDCHEVGVKLVGLGFGLVGKAEDTHVHRFGVVGGEGRAVAGGGQRVEACLHGGHRIGHTLRVGHRVKHVLPFGLHLGALLGRGRHPPHISDKDSENQNQSNNRLFIHSSSVLFLYLLLYYNSLQLVFSMERKCKDSKNLPFCQIFFACCGWNEKSLQ